MKVFAVLFLAYFASVVSAWTATYCNSTSKCPEDLPCCSQYGMCGVGSYCLGGCDIRYSYNLTACMPMPRMSSFEESFENNDNIEKLANYLGNVSEADWVYTGYIASHDDALLLQMPNQSTGAVVSSTRYLWYGKVGATVKSSRGAGVVTAFITFSDVQDEIDWEWVGYNLTGVETNFYYQGVLNYSNAIDGSTTNTFKNYHYYEIDWTEDELTWSIDGAVIRTLKKEDTWNDTKEAYYYPQTPSRIQFSLWPAGSLSNSEGTIEWAGGEIDWDSEDIQDYGYYYAYVKNVTVEAYDLPSWFTKKYGNNTDAYHAFLYNSTDATEDNVYLTKKKTWLGSDEATGLDPENEDTVETVSSGSTTYTTTVARTSTKSSTSTTAASTSEYTGGFVQSNSSGSSSSSSSSGGAPSYAVERFLALAAGVFGIVITFAI